MNLKKIYHDSDGVERSILGMIRREPEWAANILQRGEMAIEALREYQRFNSIRNDFDAYLYAWGQWALSGEPKPNPEDYGMLNTATDKEG